MGATRLVRRPFGEVAEEPVESAHTYTLAPAIPSMHCWRFESGNLVASVNMVEIRAVSEVAIGQAARGGSLKVSGSGVISSAMASICM